MEDFDANDEMAALMGFSSFGGTKKRKFDQTKSPATEEDSTSGANSTELGVRIKSTEDQSPGLGSTSSAATAVAIKPPPPTGGLGSFLAQGQAPPARPLQTGSLQPGITSQPDSSASELVSFGGPAIPRAELNTLRHGVMTEHGDMAYFMPSFVEDPWENLFTGRT